MNWLIKTVLIVVCTILALAPTWFYLFVRWLAEPNGFWQEFVLGLVFLIPLGFVQFIGIIIWVIVVIAILTDDI